ncbi:hypothetical protein [Ruminiclostridium josui]|uniref:hypothetical protein n=1 Tax=Ruminiclostridium josui TaxID=1499 RepID=UPI000A882E9B
MNVRNIVLDKYSAKVYKNRKEHIMELTEETKNQPIAANSRTIPGIITNRGCCYAGCKGVVLGPLKDVLVLTHGPSVVDFIHGEPEETKQKPKTEEILLNIAFLRIFKSLI